MFGHLAPIQGSDKVYEMQIKWESMTKDMPLNGPRAHRSVAKDLIAVMLATLSLLTIAGAARGETAANTVETAHTDSESIVRATLSNGLRVIIVRNTLAPVVATSVNYLVGSDETPPGFPGTAHAQEHMMFRGSPGLTADQLADIGSVMGGNFNANTRESLTQYLFTVPAEDLDVALHIEAMRMQAVLDSAAGLETRARRHRAGSGPGLVEPELHPVFEDARSDVRRHALCARRAGNPPVVSRKPPPRR